MADFRLPARLDKPILVGEFHFGALDHGMFDTGLRKTADQKDRADKYAACVRGAMKNPQIVATHWEEKGTGRVLKKSMSPRISRITRREMASDPSKFVQFV